MFEAEVLWLIIDTTIRLGLRIGENCKDAKVQIDSEKIVVQFAFHTTSFGTNHNLFIIFDLNGKLQKFKFTFGNDTVELNLCKMQ